MSMVSIVLWSAEIFIRHEQIFGNTYVDSTQALALRFHYMSPALDGGNSLWQNDERGGD